MRYLVDAIAADREQGIDERLHEAYAFASYDEKGGAQHRREVVEKWKTKNITPIPYPEGDSHEHLHDTLRQWAQLWRGGLRSKKNIVTSYGPKSPETLTEERSQVEWAISDPAAAREFSGLKRKAGIEWLSVFDEMGFTNSTVSDESLEADIPLVDGGSSTNRPQSLSQVTNAIADWLTAHLNKPDLIHWVLRKGGHLHPEFRRKVQSRLNEGGPPQPYRALWQLLAGSEPFICRPDTSGSVVNRLSSEEWNLGLRAELLLALTPCLRLQPGGSSFTSFSPKPVSDEAEDQTVPSDPSDLARMNLGVQSYFSDLIVDQLEDRNDYVEILHDIAFDLVRLLERAMKLYELFGRVGQIEDAIHLQRPSISTHNQNSAGEWSILIDLLREAAQSLTDERLDAITRHFATLEYPIFRRFAFYSFQHSSLPEAGTLLSYILEDSNAWVWARSIQVEFFQALPQIWDQLDLEGREELGTEITEGPPRSNYREEISDDEWTRLRDLAVWNRLIRIRFSSEHNLTGSAQDELDRIEEQFPAWEYKGTEKEDFPSWTEGRWGYETDYPAESLLDRDDDEIVSILLKHGRHRQGLAESWREAVKLAPDRACQILKMLREQEGFPEDVWKSSIRGFRDVEVEEEIHTQLLDMIESLSNENLKILLHPLSSLLETIARSGEVDLDDLIFSLWDRLWPISVQHEVRDEPDPINTAISHPAGNLAEVVVHLLRSREVAKRGGIDSDLQSRINEILSEREDAAGLARVIIASRLALFHFLNPVWTEEKVVPLFDWSSSDEARFVWSGYLWSPSMPPDLWPAMKPSFLVSFENLDQLQEGVQRNLAVLLVAIAVEGEPSLSAEEARNCLRQLGDQDRGEAARWIVRRLEGAGDRVEKLWSERIGPWIESAWPREEELKSSETSVSLAWAAIQVGEAFPDAVNTIESRVGSLNRPAHVLGRLGESGLPHAHPEPALQLLNVLVDNISFRYDAEKLQQCLENIASSKPVRKDDPRYVRLMDLAEQNL
jgi:hypothetical protein